MRNARGITTYGGDRCHIAAMDDRRCMPRLPHHRRRSAHAFLLARR